MKTSTSSQRRLMGLVCTLLLFSASLLARADQIVVSNPQGQKMTVEVLSYTASSGNVQIKRDDGQILNTKLSVFDKESQEKIVANAPKELATLDLDVTIGRTRERQGASSYMKNQSISAKVKVTNQSRDIDLADTKFTILLVGRNSRRYANRDEDWYKILSNQTFDTKLAAGKFSEHELKSVRTSYDSDKDNTNVGGWEFEGYLLVAQDADGKVIATKTTLGDVKTYTVKVEKLLLAAIALKEGAETKHDLSPLTRR
jgi:hypothetical protein